MWMPAYVVVRVLVGVVFTASFDERTGLLLAACPGGLIAAAAGAFYCHAASGI
jgi:hypothetical protein